MERVLILLLAFMPGIMLSQNLKLIEAMESCEETASPSFMVDKKWFRYHGTDGAAYYLFKVSNPDELKMLYENLEALLKANEASFDKPSVDESQGEPLNPTNIEAFYDDVMYGDSTVYKKWLLEPERGDEGDRIEFRLMPATFHIIVRDTP